MLDRILKRTPVMILAFFFSGASFAADWNCVVPNDADDDSEEAIATYQCISNWGTPVCPVGPYPCFDKLGNSTTPLESEDSEGPDGMMLIDDGERDQLGMCLSDVFLFSGRAMSCQRAGIKTAGQNCCADTDEVFQENVGSLSQTAMTGKAIAGVFRTAKAAVTAYRGATAVGQTVTQAAQAGAQAGQSAMMAAFDPTSLAISIAVYVVMEYLTKGCDQDSLETAMLKSSGFCHKVGTYCTKKIEFIGCVQKETSYCCFNSRMARIIHEQGRPQLAAFQDGWGAVKSPDCRGLTPEQFQALDFSEIDMSEYYRFLSGGVTQEMTEKANEAVNRYLDHAMD